MTNDTFVFDSVDDLFDQLDDSKLKSKKKQGFSNRPRRYRKFRSSYFNGKVSHIAARHFNSCGGAVSLEGRLSVPTTYERDIRYPTSTPRMGTAGTNALFKNASNDSHEATFTENPLLMTNTNPKQSYVRAVNDYTISLHEMYSNHFGKLPSSSTIFTIKDAPYGEIDKIMTKMETLLTEKGFHRLDQGDIFYHDDEEEADEYSVYQQSVALYGNESSNVGIEFLGTPVMVVATLITDNKPLNKELIAFFDESKKEFKTLDKTRKDKTFYTIASSSHGFQLEELAIKSDYSNEIVFDNYNDDFAKADEVIKQTIEEEKKGLILLHGTPGTGKTSYIKHLITSSAKRRIIYIPTHLTSSISSPSFISFVKSELSNSVLVIEDAEQVLLARESSDSHKEAVSNILNMTDGILADALNILIICTFNTEMENIDKALLRKGRLMLQYKFDVLNKEKANLLTQKLYGKNVDKEMSLADIYNLNYELIKPLEVKKLKMGFT